MHYWGVRFYNEKRREYRISRSRYRVRKYASERAAWAAAYELNSRSGIRNAHPVKLDEPEKERRKPPGVLVWAKWTLQRSRIRLFMWRRGMVLTSGDRTYNTLAPDGVSDHWVEARSSWADDYWCPDYIKMRAAADKLRRVQKLKQVLVHDAGSGDHIHVAGWS